MSLASLRGARRHQNADPAVPTDSVSDIAFLLIIFFILTTTLSKLAGFTTELPSADTSGKQAARTEAKTPTVHITDGRLLFNEQDVTLDSLRDRLLDLQLARKDGEERVVLLEAAGRVDYQAYFAAMAAISSAGGVVAIVEEDE